MENHQSDLNVIPKNRMPRQDFEEIKVNLRVEKAIKYYQQKYIYQLGNLKCNLNADNSSDMSNALSQLIDNDQSLAEESKRSRVNLSKNLV